MSRFHLCLRAVNPPATKVIVDRARSKLNLNMLDIFPSPLCVNDDFLLMAEDEKNETLQMMEGGGKGRIRWKMIKRGGGVMMMMPFTLEHVCRQQ